MTTNVYDNSRPIDVHTWSEYPQLLEATKKLYAELFSRQEKKKNKHLRIVLLDLYKCYLENPTKYVAYHRSSGSYKKSRYNALHIGIKPLLNVINALIDKGYAEGTLGFIDRSSGVSRLSRIKALPTLIEFIDRCTPDNSPKPIPPHVIYRHPDEELIILKDENKQPLEYVDTDETNRMRDELRRYNELLERNFIDINLVDYPESVQIDTTNKRVRRIFNNSTFAQGGRFYGGWWQNVKKELRKRIIMSETGQPTIEMDYKALHINLLYNKVGINYFATYGTESDPYFISDESSSEKELWRTFYKLALLVCLNCKNKESAIKAIWSEIKDKDNINKYPEITFQAAIEEAIDLFEERHRPIRSFFYTGIGLQLQRIDSIIAEKVMRHFVAEHIPVLCMHDSFICTTRDSSHLEDVIKTAMTETIEELREEWGNCPITPVSKETDYRLETQPLHDPEHPFVEFDLEELINQHNANGSYETRIRIWRKSKAQTIINYTP